MSSLSRNTLFSLINQIISVAVPFITFPYISRVLGPEKYGTLNYALSIISLFGIFGGIGLISYATREISKCRNNIEKLSKSFIEIFIIQFLLTITVFIIYFIFIYLNDGLEKYFLLFLVNGLTLFTNLFTFQWFFVGTEDFKYITARDGLVKITFVVMIFAFVRDQNDMVLYVILNLISLLISAMVNSIFLIKKVKIKKYNLTFRAHLKPVTLALIMSFISTLTIQLNAVLLGSIATKENLGYYNVGLKIITMTVNIISSALVVMLPRLSYLNGTKDLNAQRNLMGKISDILMMFSIPAAIGLFLYSKEIITLLFGASYIKAIHVSEITAVCLIIMPLTGILYNYIYSNNKEHYAIYNMVISLIINIAINIVLVPKFLFIGAAVSFVVVELSKLLTYLVFMKKLNRKMSIFSKSHFQYILVSVFTLVFPFVIVRPTGLIFTISIIFLSSFCYFLILIKLQNPYCLMFVKIIKSKIIKKVKINFKNV